MKKTLIIIGITLLVLIVLLIPKVDVLKDGEIKKYTSLTYQIIKKHTLNDNNKNYEDGLIVKIFGIEVYNDIDNKCEEQVYTLGEKSDTKINNIYVKIEATNISNTKVTLTMTNLTNDDYYYGNPFTIEVEKDGEWYKMIAPEDLVFTMPAYTLKAKEQRKFVNHKWYFSCDSPGYGKLPKGHYRIVKDVNKVLDNNKFGDDIHISAEFKID